MKFIISVQLIIIFQKEYYEDNKEKSKLYHDQRRQENSEKNHISHNCECGGKYVIPQIAVHNKTKKHIKYIEEQKSQP